jgi:uncharacterized membrane protein
VRLLSGDYLFSDQTTTPSGYFTALTVFFGLLLVASIVVYWRRGRLAPKNPPLVRILRQASKSGMWIAVIGLFFALMRYTQVEYLSKPIYMLLVIFAMIFTAGYFVYEWSERYPVATYQLEQARLQRRFVPAGKPRSEPQRPRPKVRGKRRR